MSKVAMRFQRSLPKSVSTLSNIFATRTPSRAPSGSRAVGCARCPVATTGGRLGASVVGTDARGDALVVFGITGDLAFKHILPALQRTHNGHSIAYFDPR